MADAISASKALKSFAVAELPLTAGLQEFTGGMYVPLPFRLILRSCSIALHNHPTNGVLYAV
jgi:hypothetical protein